MSNIHPTAIISPNAQIDESVKIGPYSVVEEDVVIGKDTIIGAHVCVYNGARIGERVKIHQGAAVANIPQDLKFSGEEKTEFIIGNDTVIREFCTLHRGTEAVGYSSVGKNCLLMAYAHVAHDCIIGDNVIIANSVQIGGHVTIEDYVIIGGCTPVHQFSKIGKHAMVGGAFRVTSDVPPFVMAAGEPLRYSGLNVIGLRRRGFTNQEITDLKNAYTLIYNSGLNLGQAKEKVAEDYADNQLVQSILNFINDSDRGIIRK